MRHSGSHALKESTAAFYAEPPKMFSSFYRGSQGASDEVCRILDCLILRVSDGC